MIRWWLVKFLLDYSTKIVFHHAYPSQNILSNKLIFNFGLFLPSEKKYILIISVTTIIGWAAFMNFDKFTSKGPWRSENFQPKKNIFIILQVHMLHSFLHMKHWFSFLLETILITVLIAMVKKRVGVCDQVWWKYPDISCCNQSLYTLFPELFQTLWIHNEVNSGINFCLS